MPDWDKVYTDKEVKGSTASSVLAENLHMLNKVNGDALYALDYASGLAGNAKLLAKEGYKVEAWDSSQIAVEKVNAYAKDNKLNIHAHSYDLEASELETPDQFDVIVVSYYLYRERLREIYNLLKQGGLLFYQTFSGKQVNGIGPSREEFRLHRGELLQVYSDMELLYYREDPEDCTGDNAAPGQVCFVARK